MRLLRAADAALTAFVATMWPPPPWPDFDEEAAAKYLDDCSLGAQPRRLADGSMCDCRLSDSTDLNEHSADCTAWGDNRECTNCGDRTCWLSSRDWCDGCEEESDPLVDLVEDTSAAPPQPPGAAAESPEADCLRQDPPAASGHLLTAARGLRAWADGIDCPSPTSYYLLANLLVGEPTQAHQ